LKRAILTVAAALAAAAPAQAAEPTTPAPGALYSNGYTNRYLLDGPWSFRLGSQPWRQVTVPYAWNATDESPASMRGAVGWYRKEFRVPKAGKGTSWIARFESVNYRATVYLNGRLLARHEGASIPFEVDLTHALRRGTNQLLVRADSHRSLTTIPPLKTMTNGLPSGGWWNYGGILREVYLRPVDGVDMQDFLARPILPCRTCPATVLVRATLRNLSGKKQDVRTTASVGGIPARLPKVGLPPHATRVVDATVRIAHPRLWEPGAPQLYQVSAATLVGNHHSTGWSGSIGIRSIHVNRSGRVLVNGLPVKLRGASFHEENVLVGAALTPQMRVDLWKPLLTLGATLTRAHYPLHPWFLEQADRDGIMVWDEIPVYQLANSVTAKPAIRDKALGYLRDTVARDQNHPSVLTWSIGNEMPSRVGTGQARYIVDAARMLRKIDPTRLRALDYAGYPNAVPSNSYHYLDALGVNCYFGWYPGPGGQVDDRAALAPFLDLVHGYYPTKALFVTEFGAEANRDGPFDEKGTYSFQRQLIEDHVAVYDSKPFVNGALVWALRDFRVRPQWDGGNPKPQSPLNQKGLLDPAGNPKPAFTAATRLFRHTQPLGQPASR
jgi:beta-glucuronidase